MTNYGHAEKPLHFTMTNCGHAEKHLHELLGSLIWVNLEKQCIHTQT